MEKPNTQQSKQPDYSRGHTFLTFDGIRVSPQTAFFKGEEKRSMAEKYAKSIRSYFYPVYMYGFTIHGWGVPS